MRRVDNEQSKIKDEDLKANDDNIIEASRILQELKELADTVNNTCSPAEFFEKYDNMLDLTDQLIMIRGVNFIGQSPIEIKIELVEKKQPAIKKMVDRYKMYSLNHESSYEGFYKNLSAFFNEMSQDNIKYINERAIYKEFEKDELGKEILKNKLRIDTDYSEDGERIGTLKNMLVTLSSNDMQKEFINTLLKYNSSKTMHLLLIDDGIINYSIYNGVPQLIIPVVTEERRINSAIEWLFSEMQDRINKFLEVKVKNIDSFNDKRQKNREEILPKIICVVNEVKNLPDELDNVLTRLFLNSNMVGIYFVLFSRFELKSISLGNKIELLEIVDSSKLMSCIGSDERNEYSMKQKKFDNMEGHDFEYFCAKLLKENGFYNVEVTQGSGDHGIDILAEKDGITYAIQCKCYSSTIGNAAVQQAYTGKSYYKRDIAVVLTNQYFTKQADEEAKKIGVKLWDRDKLEEMVGEKTILFK
jgi:restriction system protein